MCSLHMMWGLVANTGMGRGPVSEAEVALMSVEDVFLFRQHYGAYLRHLFSLGAHDESSAAHAYMLKIVALWVSHPSAHSKPQ